MRLAKARHLYCVQGCYTTTYIDPSHRAYRYKSFSQYICTLALKALWVGTTFKNDFYLQENGVNSQKLIKFNVAYFGNSVEEAHDLNIPYVHAFISPHLTKIFKS